METKALGAERYPETHGPVAWTALLGVLRASRIHKLIPLLVLVTNAALFAGGTISPKLYLLSLAFVLCSSALGMQVNVLTDAALDRESKPRLLSWLQADTRLLRRVLWTEALACALLLLLAGRDHRLLALALACYGACFLLYSYNVLARGAEATARLKVFWWGNALTVFGGYFSLWVTGFALAGLPAQAWLWWLGVAAAVCGIDYGVFLNECAGDEREERAHGLKTLPALLGQRRTSALALALLFASALALLMLLVRSARPLPVLAASALVWHAALQALSAVLTLRLVRAGARRWEWLVDLSFWISRLGVLLLLLVDSWQSH